MAKSFFIERAWLLSLLVAAAAIWGFAELADEVIEKESHAFDEGVLRALRDPKDLARPIGPHWLMEAGRDVTALGGATVIALVTVGALAFLWLRGKHALMVLVLGAVIGGALMSTVLKNWFDRERPSIVPHLTPVSSPSFPSGHSMLAAVTYLTLGALLARSTKQPKEKVVLLAAAVMLTGMIGVSRVYLGVHYPTDVLAGWCAGLVWAVFAVMVARWLQRKGAVEAPTAGGGGGDAAKMGDGGSKLGS